MGFPLLDEIIKEVPKLISKQIRRQLCQKRAQSTEII